MIRVLMLPLLSAVEPYQSGILRVIQAYHRYSKDYGIEYVSCNPADTNMYDVLSVHAGMSNATNPNKPLVAHIHGAYWTAEYDAAPSEWKANKDVVANIRHAHIVTVPSEWVGMTLKRDMHLSPMVIPHGIEADEWIHNYQNEGYILWNKNRVYDVCDPNPIGDLARMNPNLEFVSTFAPRNIPDNVNVIGLKQHEQMKQIVQHAGVYLSTTEETFCLGCLEASASGVPTLGWRNGNLPNLITSGVDGYLARQGDYDDLNYGLKYCMDNRTILGSNARENVKRYTWNIAMPLVRQAYEEAIRVFEWEHRSMKRGG